MKVTQMPLVHAANLAANSGNTAYGVDVIKHNECYGLDVTHVTGAHHTQGGIEIKHTETQLRT